MRRHNVISGRGRNGVWVCGDKISPRPSRFETIGNFGEHVIDLSVAVPDPHLLPPLGDALAYGAEVALLNSYVRVPILDTLQAAVSKRWPYPAEAYLAANGGDDAVYVTLQALVMPGSGPWPSRISMAMRLLIFSTILALISSLSNATVTVPVRHSR